MIQYPALQKEKEIIIIIKKIEAELLSVFVEEIELIKNMHKKYVKAFRIEKCLQLSEHIKGPYDLSKAVVFP